MNAVKGHALEIVGAQHHRLADGQKRHARGLLRPALPLTSRQGHGHGRGRLTGHNLTDFYGVGRHQKPLVVPARLLGRDLSEKDVRGLYVHGQRMRRVGHR